LHETPFVWGDYKFELLYQARNLKLKEVIHDYVKAHPEKRIAEERVFLGGFYNYVILEFITKYKEGNGSKNMTEKEGVEFTLDIIRYLFHRYLYLPSETQQVSSQVC